MAVAHVLLPFVLAGFCLAARRDGTFTATFATALATAVLGAFAPPLLALSAVAALLLLVLGPGLRRARALVLLVVPAALLGPWALRFVDDWRLLLSGPGLLVDLARPRAVGSARARPRRAGRHDLGRVARRPRSSSSGSSASRRSRSHPLPSRSVCSSAACLAVVGLAGALVAERVVLGSAETGVGTSAPAHLWAGLGVAAVARRACSSACSRAADPCSRALRRPGAAGPSAAAVIAAVAVVPVAGRAPRCGACRASAAPCSVGQATLPAVALEQGGGPLGNRLLLLRPSDDVVDFVLAGQEPGELLRDLDRAPDADDAPLVDAVANIVGGRGADSLDSKALARLGIGFVQVRATADSALARRLDSSEGLSRLGTSERGILWKVQPLPAADGAAAATAPSRARLVDADGALLQVGPHARVRTPRSTRRSRPAPRPRFVVLAEADRVVAARAGDLRRRGARSPWRAPSSRRMPSRLPRATSRSTSPRRSRGGASARRSSSAFVVFMAVPFGNRRSRRRS